MDTNKENALELWEERYGEAIRVNDYADRLMDKSAYNNSKSLYGWNIDHIRPESKGGSNKKCNLELCNIETNSEKGDSFPYWTANGKKFRARKIERNCYEIEEID